MRNEFETMMIRNHAENAVKRIGKSLYLLKRWKEFVKQWEGKTIKEALFYVHPKFRGGAYIRKCLWGQGVSTKRDDLYIWLGVSFAVRGEETVNVAETLKEIEKEIEWHKDQRKRWNRIAKEFIFIKKYHQEIKEYYYNGLLRERDDKYLRMIERHEEDRENRKAA